MRSESVSRVLTATQLLVKMDCCWNPLERCKLKTARLQVSEVSIKIRLAISTFVCLFSIMSGEFEDFPETLSHFSMLLRFNLLIFYFQSQIEQQQLGTEDKKRTGWPQSVWGRETLGRKTLK